jgi:hypothetical protein
MLAVKKSLAHPRSLFEPGPDATSRFVTGEESKKKQNEIGASRCTVDNCTTVI